MHTQSASKSRIPFKQIRAPGSPRQIQQRPQQGKSGLLGTSPTKAEYEGDDPYTVDPILINPSELIGGVNLRGFSGFSGFSGAPYSGVD